MPSLKDLKNRISSVKSTRKITSAMKMVAGSKLRRAQEKAESARPYAARMARMLSSLATSLAESEAEVPRLISGTGKEENVLVIVVTADRGLCGAFNSNAVREARRLIRQHEADGKTVSLICVGRKGRDLLRKDHASKILFALENVGRKGGVTFEEADNLNGKILAMYDEGKFDICEVVYNRFKSVISQVVTVKQLVPFTVEKDPNLPKNVKPEPIIGLEFEPDRKSILEALLPRALSVAIYGALLESMAGSQAAQMTAMDNATRNAGEMINKLTLNYNRSRQAAITKELIEIISGAEAV
ncbi:MAG: F0F1 ATP synthase subunit gamma [Alphaproteobacteria bacterium]|nr:F0F1 ATP synthase subunit gamma [Alphaproteobacteria bacterium]